MTTSGDAPWALDKMKRKGVAKFLTRYLDSNDKIKVLNINSEWGSGKTFFLENWRKEQEPNRVCIHFNAWENDFTGDAFVALVSTIRDQLTDHIGPAQDAENALTKFTKVAAKTLMAATPALAKGLVKKFTGVEVSVLTEAIGDEALGEATEKAVEKLISSNKETLDTVRSFKVTFEKLLEIAKALKAIEAGKENFVYIFIDELDRCRPTFAIELLERIKHLFTVDQCKFIIATDTVQLGHSIKAVYGSEFSAEKYLKRFFDSEFTLDNNDLSLWVSANVNFKNQFVISRHEILTHYDQEFVYTHTTSIPPAQDAIVDPKLDDCQIIILALALTFKTKLRELEKIIMQIEAAQANTDRREFSLFWGAYLIFLKDADSGIYNLSLHGDSALAIQKLREKYKAKLLYFGDHSASVHDVFAQHLTRHLKGEREAKESHKKSVGDGLSYIQAINEEWSRNYHSMQNYPKLVDLAHSLD
jgi:hypothetical protein